MNNMTAHPHTTIGLKFVLLFIPTAYITYLFHEFGHWSIGELLGNDMSYSLNYVRPRTDGYLDASHDVFVSIGGPGFTILQSLIGLLIIEKYKTFYAYPLVFFPMFNRFFSLAFGGFGRQDEARISVLLDAGTYTVAVIVIAILVLMVVRCSSILKIDRRNNGYISMVSTACQLLVIGSYELFS